MAAANPNLMPAQTRLVRSTMVMPCRFYYACRKMAAWAIRRGPAMGQHVPICDKCARELVGTMPPELTGPDPGAVEIQEASQARGSVVAAPVAPPAPPSNPPNEADRRRLALQLVGEFKHDSQFLDELANVLGPEEDPQPSAGKPSAPNRRPPTQTRRPAGQAAKKSQRKAGSKA